MKKTDQFAEDIWQSANNIESAKAPDFLFESIMEKIDEETDIVPINKLKWIAIAASLLIGLNILSVSTDNDSSEKLTINNTDNVLSNYNLYQNL
ncbi:hypothetical protein [Frigoriflavimonas asaccharolytica]|uniref:Uncharacterized protein n=1 Tax=Frigoriflavimonas asaccharolytica TaxID=2735899 RepID=A0A8J8G8W4_9FLAO|nr:hypothetical protein [Frigoriflavimonas asaccharolytica]NRS92097.1 hypothetical protein [Frigoriflavimonas asaccharolytica]